MKRHRTASVGDQIRLSLARMLREELRDPRLGFVTVTDVEMSPDLRHARVFVSVLDGDQETTLDALRHAAPFLRRGLAREARLKHTPELRFATDPSIVGGFRIEKILDEVGVEPSDVDAAEPEDPSGGDGSR